MNSSPLQALTSSMNLLKNIHETSGDVYWVLDKTGNFIYISPSVLQQRGFTPEELIGRSAMDAIYEEDKPRAKQTFDLGLEIIDKGLTRLPAGKVRLRQVHKQGGFVWTEVISEFFFDENREFMFVLGLSSNVSQLVAAEQEIADLKKALQQKTC
ncbi:MAG TPA: PAS domain S-box protein [Candidatus Rifleibacterium sp.]|nr:PAS domain S-box protein [Candidatus Rifleibacterium sp.]HPT45839.1 PAS domain S-box protein [Candidatus Rifleibacterium sp.]